MYNVFAIRNGAEWKKQVSGLDHLVDDKVYKMTIKFETKKEAKKALKLLRSGKHATYTKE